jgi:hypothetical protein
LLPVSLFWVWSGLDAFAFFLGLGYVAHNIGQRSWEAWQVDRVRVFCILLVVLYFAPILTRPVYFDRYVLPMVPVALVALFYGLDTVPGRARQLAAWGLCALVGSFSVLATRDYLVHHSMRTALIEVAHARGAQDADIEGGFEFDGDKKFDILDPRAIAQLEANRPEALRAAAHVSLVLRTRDEVEAPADEWPTGQRYVVSVSPHIDGYEVIAKRSSRRFIPYGLETLYLHERIAGSS